MATHGISDYFGAGGEGLVPDGQSPNLRDLLRGLKGSVGAPVASTTALKALTADNYELGQIRLVTSSPPVAYICGALGTASTSVLTADDGLVSWYALAGGGSAAAIVHAPVANSTALQGIAAADRADGMITVKLDTYDPWIFDADSAVGSDAWTLVPTAGSGRFIRPWLSRTDLSTTGSATLGANLIGLRDVGTIITATTVEGALQEIKTLVDAGMTSLKKTVTIGHADLTDADGSQTIDLDTALPANARIVGVDMHTFTPFTGGGAGAVTVDVGSAGDVDALVDGANLFAAAVDGGPATMPVGVRPNKTFGAGGQLTATVEADVNVADLDAGAVTIDVLYVILA